jgi:hypothetical protein
MGFPLLIGALFGWTLFAGFCIGLFYPIYTAFFSDEARQGKIISEAKSPFVLALASIINAFRFTGFSILAFFVLAFLFSIFFSIFAILRSVFT